MIAQYLKKPFFSERIKNVDEGQWIRRENLLWLLVAQIIVVFPLLFYLPTWLIAVWLLTLVWRIQVFRGRAAFPNFAIKSAIGAAGMLGIYASFQGVKGIEPMTALLVFSFVFKTIELRTRKDAHIIVFIGFIVIAAQFLFAQDILATAMGVFSCIILITAWETIYHRKKFPLGYKLKRGAWLLVHCVPLMLVFFVIMPRIGPLWSVPVPGQHAKTGFSESLSIGDIGNLAMSTGVAFRVSFSEVTKIPDNKDLYWRGVVLDRFDGKTWQRSPKPQKQNWALENQLLRSGELAGYEVIMEPHQHQWLFALMSPIAVNWKGSEVAITDDYLLKSKIDIHAKIQYEVTSVLSRNNDFFKPLSDRERWLNTRLPTNSNPRTQALAKQWRNQGLSAHDVMQLALERYADTFFYTLSPPLLGVNGIDEFLFMTQKGFCEHFASSFVFLMRAADVPARVVIGYQGGTPSAIGDYMIVSQADAHAWAEVWLEEQGWVRVDPTAAVAPSRVELGLSDALSAADRANLGGHFWQANSMLRQLQHRWDAMGYSWTKWVLNYNSDLQQGILRQLLGGIEAWRIGLAMLGVFIVIIGLYMLLFWFFNRRLSHIPIEVKVYQRYCKKLARYQIQRQVDETPSQLYRRVIEQLPYAHKSASHINYLFTQVSYAGKREYLPDLQKAIAAFPSLSKSYLLNGL